MSDKTRNLMLITDYSRRGGSFDSRFPFEYNDTIRKVGRHDKVVLNDEGGAFGMKDKPLDNLGGDNSLFRIKEGRRLVE
jgi:hypothetical protein